MGSSMKLLREYVSEIAKEPKLVGKRLRVFDFDDTLVKTDAVVHVTRSDGSTFDMVPGEFAAYDKQLGETFDYRDFTKLINPRAIVWTNRILHNVYAHHGPNGIVVLSARSTTAPIEQFLHSTGLRGIETVALGTPTAEAKAAWIDARIRRDSLDVVECFDDSHKTVVAIRALQPLHPNTKIIVRHVAARRIASLWA
jgi:hypothetical protein